MRDDKSSSRGPDGSPRDPDGVGIPSRSAPASTSDEKLIDRLERALHALKADGDDSELWASLALGQVEQAIRRWRAESAARRYPFAPLGRPQVIVGDVELLLTLRNVNPGSDCQMEFAKTFGGQLTKQRISARYRAADKAISKTNQRS